MKIDIHGTSGITRYTEDKPFNLLHVLQKLDQQINAPCGGKGTCGKCRVDIDNIGSVLSCQTVISEQWLEDHGLNEDDVIQVRVPISGKAKISTEGLLPDLDLAPLLNRGVYHHTKADIHDQRSDEQRFEDETGLKIPFYLLNRLHDKIKQQKDVEFFFRRDTGEITYFPESGSARLLGMAVDIGTTTLAAWLYDLEAGNNLSVVSMMNPQRSYGADVISRIEQVDNNIKNLEAMSKQIQNAVSQLGAQLLRESALEDEVISSISISGNTTMMHLLMELNPSDIARSPFIPVSLSARVLRAEELGFIMPGNPLCLLLPSISAYVGADLTAGMMACKLFPTSDKKQLLVDLGTNGEIILSVPGGILSCSTAAGPAFEAANISCGMSGSDGAIDAVNFNDGNFNCSVIGEGKISGVCGSGLVSIIAVLLEQGVIDETGRFTDEPELLPSTLAERLIEDDNGTRFYLDQAGGEVFLNQKDIRELQNAKAAVAAGVAKLLKQAGIEASELDEVLIAGGFGNYLAAADAYAIGLLPEGARDKTRAVGNTSGMGAAACLLNEQLRQDASLAALAVDYYELSADPEFTDLYIEAMMFPE
jgi:uncharacterized 2Fe-2S/4Fe-4S cluster protein (DUF4445 family)